MLPLSPLTQLQIFSIYQTFYYAIVLFHQKTVSVKTNTHKDPIALEAKRLFRIFGGFILVWLIFLSFFNEHRSSNNPNADETTITASSRLFFKNVRRPYYDTEYRKDAKMELYRYGSRLDDSTANTLHAVLILNPIMDAAYLYLEPMGELKHSDPVTIKWIDGNENEYEASFNQGDRHSHLLFFGEIFPHLESSVQFFTRLNGQEIPILLDKNEIEALRITGKDYYRLIGHD